MPTTNPLDVSGDHLYFDNLEDVTLLIRQTDDTFTSQVVLNCLKRDGQKGENTAGRATQIHTSIFNMWKAELAGTEPKVQDVISQENGDQWVITDVNIGTFAQKFRCSVTKVRKTVVPV